MLVAIAREVADRTESEHHANGRMQRIDRERVAEVRVAVMVMAFIVHGADASEVK